MPEPYLWRMFRGLAEALHAIHHGGVVSKGTHEDNLCIPVGDWVPVINPDVKLANVVLGDAHSDYCPAYKRPQMIDFGLAFGGEDHEHAAMMHTIDTPGCWPHLHPDQTTVTEEGANFGRHELWNFSWPPPCCSGESITFQSFPSGEPEDIARKKSPKGRVDEEIGGMVPRSLLEKRAKRKAKEAEKKKTSITEDRDITMELRAELVKQDVAVKNLEYEAVNGDHDVQIEVLKSKLASIVR
ncbi:hypothetical protein E8E11_007822 [Didymella keratinophila]|nr:hypothetical protein E8E11_007822 [Didymella keratinophila]